MVAVPLMYLFTWKNHKPTNVGFLLKCKFVCDHVSICSESMQKLNQFHVAI